MAAKVLWYPPMDTPPTAHQYIGFKARPGIEECTQKIALHAEMLLADAKANPAEPILHELGRTEIDLDMGIINGRVYLIVHPSAGATSVNALAVEYGHQPSGYFAGTKTKAPAGLYILTRAMGVC
jgi:hypothetical protein